MDLSDKNKEKSCLKQWDVNNLYGWLMSQKLPVNTFQQIQVTFEFNEHFTKKFNEGSDVGYFLEADVQYPKKIHELHHDLLFLPERMKIENAEKLVTNLHKNRICNSHKKFKASIKWWINFEKK